MSYIANKEAAPLTFADVVKQAQAAVARWPEWMKTAAAEIEAKLAENNRRAGYKL